MRFIAAVLASLALVFGLLTAAPADAQVPTSFTLGTHNMLHGKATPHRFADVIGWQEADGGKAKLRALKGYATYAPNDVPISYRTSQWDLVAKGSIRTHRGNPRVSPHRYITWVVLKHERTGSKITVLNTHFVSGAWNSNDREKDESWRRVMWRTHDAKLRQIVEQRSARGERLFITGDFNRMSPPSYPCVRATNARGVDFIYRSTSSRAGAAEALPKWGSDHRARRVSVRVH